MYILWSGLGFIGLIKRRYNFW